MTTKKFFSHVVQALTVAAVTIPMAGEAIAQGYGYGNQTGGGGYQAPPPKRHITGKQAYSGSNPHLAWCYSRYRSYRQSDNTFQPYHGPRKECLSPYESERRALFFGDPGNDDSGSRLTGRDRFGNLPEQGRAGDAPAFAPNGRSDDFGNLPEQPPVANPAPAAAAEVDPGTARAGVPLPVVTPTDDPEVEIAETPRVEPASTEESTLIERPEVEPADVQAAVPDTDASAGSAKAQSVAAPEIEETAEIVEPPAVQPVSADNSTVTEQSEVDPADAQADLPATDAPTGSVTIQPAAAPQIGDTSEGSPDAE
tara:strand:- start:137 stop:1069 length:933 start_codon:yes stop_codon:yes gene_type:complete